MVLSELEVAKELIRAGVSFAVAYEGLRSPVDRQELKEWFVAEPAVPFGRDRESLSPTQDLIKRRGFAVAL